MKVLLSLFVFIFFATGCDQSPKVYSFNGMTMGTTYSMKYVSSSNLTVKEVKAKIEETLIAENKVMSTFDKQSELSKINYSDSTKWHDISESLFTVINEAKRIELLSAGAFDITVGPAVNLWGFGPDGERKVPSKQLILKTLARVGGKFLLLDTVNRRLKKSIPDLYLDLSAIAKGHGVDRAGSRFEELGITNYMVEIGGEVRTRGLKPNGEAWKIAIEAPEAGRGSYAKILDISGRSIATSGNYRNFFESQGKHFSHTIDPLTAKPVEHRLISASVVEDQCMTADALATALMVLGPVKGIEFVEKNQMVAFLIYQEESTLKTYASKKFVEIFGEDKK